MSRTGLSSRMRTVKPSAVPFVLIGLLASCVAPSGPDGRSNPPPVRAGKGGGSGGNGIVVTSVNPPSVDRGATHDLSVGGSGFEPGAEVSFRFKGKPAKNLVTNTTTFVSPTELDVNVTVEFEADLGLYDVVVKNGPSKGVGSELLEVTEGIIDLHFLVSPDPNARPQDIVSAPLQAGLDGENSSERIFTNSDGGDVLTLTYTIPAGHPCLSDPDLNLVQLFNGQQVTATGYRVIADKKPDKHGRWEHVSRAAVNLGGLSNPIDPTDQDTYKIQFVGYNSVFDPVTDVAFTETATSTIVAVDNQNVQVDRRGMKGNDTERDTCEVVASYTFEAIRPSP